MFYQKLSFGASFFQPKAFYLDLAAFPLKILLGSFKKLFGVSISIGISTSKTHGVRGTNERERYFFPYKCSQTLWGGEFVATWLCRTLI